MKLAPTTERLAWIVELEEHRCLVFAATWAKAKWAAVAAWREAGYGTDGRWPFLKGGRSERHDCNLLKDVEPHCWNLDYAEDWQ